jgi:hypothetical protein
MMIESRLVSLHSQLPPKSFRPARLESLCCKILPWMSEGIVTPVGIYGPFSCWFSCYFCAIFCHPSSIVIQNLIIVSIFNWNSNSLCGLKLCKEEGISDWNQHLNLIVEVLVVTLC